MRASLLLTDIAKLREQKETDTAEQLKQNLQALASALSSEVDNLESISFEEFESEVQLEESVRADMLHESMMVTIYGSIVSASGLAKLLGYMAKAIAKILVRMGFKNIDPEKEGETFIEIGEYIHHLYLDILMKLAGKMGVPKEKQKLAANVIFGVLLGAAMSFTGIELYSAVKGGKLALALGEGGMAGIKIGEGAETGANIANLMKQAFETVPELAGVVVDVAETSEEVMDAIEAIEAAS